MQEQVKPIQENLLVKCPELSKHEGTTGSMVIVTLTNWAAEYNDCAARQHALIDAVRNNQDKEKQDKGWLWRFLN